MRVWKEFIIYAKTKMRLMWCDVLINTIYFNSIGFVPEHVVKIVTQLSGG